MRKVGIFLIFLLLGMLLAPQVSAEQKTLYLNAGETAIYDLKDLEKDTKITYEWEIYQHGDDYVRFWIEASNGTRYVETSDDLSGAGTWKVPKTGNYKIFWKNENEVNTVRIDHEIKIKKPGENNTPGFGFAETAVVLGLVALSYFVRKREPD
jgi:hypothetical protein